MKLLPTFRLGTAAAPEPSFAAHGSGVVQDTFQEGALELPGLQKNKRRVAWRAVSSPLFVFSLIFRQMSVFPVISRPLSVFPVIFPQLSVLPVIPVTCPCSVLSFHFFIYPRFVPVSLSAWSNTWPARLPTRAVYRRTASAPATLSRRPACQSVGPAASP